MFAGPPLKKIGYAFTVTILLCPSCKKDRNTGVVDEIFKNSAVTIQGNTGTDFKNVPVNPVIRFSFTAPVNKDLATASVLLAGNNAAAVPLTISFENADSVI